MFAFDFDPSLPTVAVSEFSAGERRVHAGEAFDWRAHGMTEIEVIPLLRAGFLRQERGREVNAEDLTAAAAAMTDSIVTAATEATKALEEFNSKLAVVNVTPGERIAVPPPAERRGRRR